MSDNHYETYTAQDMEFEECLQRNILNIKKIKRVTRDDFDQMNANFIYIMALFERYIGNLNKYVIKTKKPIKEKYIKTFEGVCKDIIKNTKSKNPKHREAMSFFNKPLHMIRNYAFLERENKNISPLSFSINLFEDYLKQDERFKEKILYLKEARERRNLLVHRGREPDKIYTEQMKINNINEKKLNKIFKIGLYPLSTKFSDVISKRVENSIENPKDLSIHPNYLHHIIMLILELKEMIKMDLKIKNMNSCLHDRIKFGIKYRHLPIIVSSHILLIRLIHHHHNQSIKSLDIANKVNFLICRDILVNKKLVKVKSRKKDRENVLKIVDSINNNEHNLAEGIKELLKNYIEKNKSEFKKNTIKMIKKNKKSTSPDEIQDWLIFHRYIKFLF